MRTIKWKVARPLGLLATLCAGTSCSSIPSITPRVSHVEIRDQIRQATLIVVGTVENEHAVRVLGSGSQEGSGRLQLCAVRVRAEGVLEGQLSSSRLTFYYYQATGAWDGPEPNIITPGERDIFYLVKEREAYRATTDAYASHTRLVTGKHSVSPAINKDQVRQSIARLLLLPEEGTDLSAFLGSLHRNTALALDLVGKAEVRQILQTLLANPRPEIRGRACITLAEFPLNEKGCLEGIIHDAHTLPEDRKRAVELMGSS